MTATRPVLATKSGQILSPSFIHIYPHALAVRSPLFTFFDDIRIHSMAKLNLVVGSMLGPPNMSQIMWSACLNRRATRRRSTTPPAWPGSRAEPEAIVLVVTSTHGAGMYLTICSPLPGILPNSSRISPPSSTEDRLGIAVMTPSARAARRWIGCWPGAVPADWGSPEIDVTQHEIPEDAAETWIHDWMTLIG